MNRSEVNCAVAPSAGRTLGQGPKQVDALLSAPVQQQTAEGAGRTSVIAEKAPPEKHTYGQILKSSAMVGGSAAANVVIGVVRTKATAAILGPAGYGLFGLFGSIGMLTQVIAGMGVSSSGVRQIAAAVGSGDSARIALTTVVLRRTSVLLGLLGALSLLVFSRQISIITFGNNGHAAAVCLLSIAVLLQLMSWGQGALIQGLRRIADLAKMQTFGAVFGLFLTVPLVYFLRENGVVPALIGVSLTSLAFSWWYSRKIHVQIPSVTISEVTHEAAALLKLGLVFMATGLMTTGIGYAVRIMVLRKVGFAATGYYHSAWTVGGLNVGFILQAMGADFYPRLTAHAHDNRACNRLVNEQARVGLLLSGPGILATLTFSPLVILVFYGAKFGPAVELLRWMCLGSTLQVVTWPLIFIIIAKGRQGLYFAAEFAWAIASLALAWACLKLWGLNGAGIAFFASYIFYGLLLSPVVSRISHFRWSAANKWTGLYYFAMIAMVFYGFYVLPFALATCLGILVTLASAVYSVWVLSRLMTWDQVPSVLRRMLGPCRPLFCRICKRFDMANSRLRE